MNYTQHKQKEKFSTKLSKGCLGCGCLIMLALPVVVIVIALIAGSL